VRCERRLQRPDDGRGDGFSGDAEQRGAVAGHITAGFPFPALDAASGWIADDELVDSVIQVEAELLEGLVVRRYDLYDDGGRLDPNRVGQRPVVRPGRDPIVVGAAEVDGTGPDQPCLSGQRRQQCG
jgi:hypothetical protein